MLSEIENGAAIFLDVKDKYFPNKSEDQLFQEWSDRLDILQVLLKSFLFFL